MLANGVHILKIDQSEMYLQELKESLSNPWATMKLQQRHSVLMNLQARGSKSYATTTHPSPTAEHCVIMIDYCRLIFKIFISFIAIV